jgi:hypothetical protein
MTLASAEALISRQVLRMNALYLQPFFDEWAVLGLGPAGAAVRAYHGPRADAFRTRLVTDSAALRGAMSQRAYEAGDFEFAQTAAGEGYDACLKIGDASYLVCNNLAATMDDLRRDPQWLKVQVVWFELAEQFRADPLA